MTTDTSRKQRRFERRLAERREKEWQQLVGKIALSGLESGGRKHERRNKP